jgi:DNA-binding transcriptional ArsR family regulator
MTLTERLARYMRNHHGWIAKAQLQDLVRKKTNYTAENVGRRLRELENDGVLEVSYRGRHAFYRLKEKEATLFS